MVSKRGQSQSLVSFPLMSPPMDTWFQWILPNCSVVTQMALVKFSGSQKDMDMDVGKGGMSGQVGTEKKDMG